MRHPTTALRTSAPPLEYLWAEFRAATNLAARAARPADREPAMGRTHGAPVMVIPGFLATDASTATLRRRLGEAGHGVRGWGLGLNLGADETRVALLTAGVRRLAERKAAPVALVGWSLGGLYAREVAKRAPDAVDRVITLGTPFSGDRRANRAWWLYEWINRHPVDRLPFDCDLAAKPPVPTIAIWSRRDGIVAGACARGQRHERDRAVEIDCTHIGLTYEPAAIGAVLDALAD